QPRASQGRVRRRVRELGADRRADHRPRGHGRPPEERDRVSSPAGPGVPESEWAENREDYAQASVPVQYRTWSTVSLFGVMFGITTAMFFLSWGGTLVLAYGTQALVWGMV